MTVASTLLCLGFALLIALGLFALGLVIAASFFALLAAGADCARMCGRVGRWVGKCWYGLGSPGRQFALCWTGITFCFLLAFAGCYAPHDSGNDTPLDGFDLLGLALCLPALAQTVDRWRHRGDASP